MLNCVFPVFYRELQQIFLSLAIVPVSPGPGMSGFGKTRPTFAIAVIRRITRFSILIIFPAFCFFPFFPCRADASGVEIVFSENSGEIRVDTVSKEGFDMGEVGAKEKKRYTIKLKNGTDGKIGFEQWRSPCPCLEFEDTVDGMEAAGEKNVVAILDGAGYKGSFSKYMYIGYSGEDGEKQSFFLPVKFTVRDDDGEDEAKKEEAATVEPVNEPGDANRILYFDFNDLKKDGAENIKSLAEHGAWIFAAKDCPSCNYLKKNVLQKLFNPEFGFKNIDPQTRRGIITVNLDVKENFLLMLKIEEILGAKGRKSPVLYWNGALHYGAEDIKKLAAGEIKSREYGTTNRNALVAALEDKDIDTRKLLDRKAGEITLGVILLAGLADGVNPCVFSTLIFFISLLSVAKVGGRKLIVTGCVYCLACFLAYLALGFGLLNFLKIFSGYKSLQSWIDYLTAGILMFLAIASFIDAWRYHRTAEAASVRLQLPGKVKELIHRVMKAGLSYRFLVPGIFTAGVLVTGLEAVCTGQVYVPVLIFLSRSPEGSGSAIFYLLLYNLMFILPLIVVFVAAYFGAGTLRLVKWGRREVTAAKVFMGLFFIVLAVFLLWLRIR